MLDATDPTAPVRRRVRLADGIVRAWRAVTASFRADDEPLHAGVFLAAESVQAEELERALTRRGVEARLVTQSEHSATEFGKWPWADLLLFVDDASPCDLRREAAIAGVLKGRPAVRMRDFRWVTLNVAPALEGGDLDEVLDPVLAAARRRRAEARAAALLH